MVWENFSLPRELEQLAGDTALEKIHNYYQLYDKISDTAICVYKVVLDEHESIKDIVLVYSNPRHSHLMKPEHMQEIVGHSYLDFVNDTAFKWLKISYDAAFLGKRFADTIYTATAKKFMKYTAQRAFAKGYVMFTFSSITDMPNLDELIRRRWQTDEVIVSISQYLRMPGSLKSLCQRVFAEMANYLKPSGIYIVEHSEEGRKCLFEWCAPHIASVKDVINDLSVKVAHKAWHTLVEGENVYMVDNVEALRDFDYSLYSFYSCRGVKSFVIAPFYYRGEVQGALVVENPLLNPEIDVKRLLEMSAYLLGAELRANTMLQKLHFVSRHDLLTGLYNRNAMEQDVDELVRKQVELGLVFADLNGMKRLNDTEGHAAGDLLLKRAARLLELLFGQGMVYRIGGDEFLVLSRQYSQKEFEERVLALRVQAKFIDVSLSVGSRYLKNSASLREEMRKADREMYNAKQEYYKTHPQEKMDSRS